MQNFSSFKFSPTAFAVIAACVLATGGALVFSSASRAADEPKAGQPRPALTVSTAQPQRTSVPLRLAANGNVAAWQEASIGAESNGLRLTDVRVNVGDVVKAGQVLATFSAETVQADVAQMRASLLEAQANAAEAAANADRARSLQATGALSQQQIQQYTTAEKTAQARVEAAKATLNAQQLRLKYTQVVAPDSGVISARTATVGAVVGAGTELFRMVRKGRLEWRAEVTSTELRRIAPGAKVSVTAASGAAAEGTVRMVAPTVDPQTRNALVYVDLPANSDFRAGMFARGEFALGQSDALTVPQEALVVRDGFSYVFVVGAEQRVQQRKVQTGRRVADRVEVLSGLDANASVAVRGAGFLNDGDLVRVVGAPPASGSTSSLQEFKQKVPVAQVDQALVAIK
ncbi:efflux RND transporter periplasmic adaptor subunit [Acidovorax sp. sif1233]|uniref:efflux RND transporter periplasmic adaptor subunit n=1 Tax=unclassified Acidovorax TaxID=2684926 RepID=UPI001C437381|nr:MULTISPECIES: efflux RND transporter periplasmic adaptor subunit [unclassified Acidovorax]MBV7430648.1 efflux RND transporter periplasmic adaptor subunit [Acidovorax sp. sif0732]MBV7449072.1 efflux RND transporter periplasmic adaptor subunit [Acidovorax sp. sif0715]MBV7457028.1 efflux RND transporter periplasmic adaptor subunit [Acidovorax sp. sif1233]